MTSAHNIYDTKAGLRPPGESSTWSNLGDESEHACYTICEAHVRIYDSNMPYMHICHNTFNTI